ncbi:MAG: hypothetical protein IID33_11295 [Planctomycetes bacterium]|nr:hypothetical protein [Planctomycetota bacterium]
MSYAFDLTKRQADRVLLQALRTQTRLEIEPRGWQGEPPICGALKSIDANLLSIELDRDARPLPLSALVGAFCDVQTVLSDQVYTFGTCVLHVYDATTPRRLVLAVPESVQVCNRRQFVRRPAPQTSIVHIVLPHFSEPCTGELCSASGNGMACRVARDLEDEFLIGEPAQTRFELPGLEEFFDLPTIICNKTPSSDGNGLVVGLQFDLDDDNPGQRQAIERLRAFLCSATAITSETEGDA